MQIRQSDLFLQQFEKILFIIASDKLSAALNFQKEIIKNFNTLKDFPYKSKQSQYYNDITIRDLTVKGYTIIYRVQEDKKCIDIIEIFNRHLPVSQSK